MRPLQYGKRTISSLRRVMTMLSNMSQKSLSRVAVCGFLTALLAGLTLPVAGWGYRLQWWEFRPGFTIFGWAGYGGLAAAALSLWGLVVARPGGPRRGFLFALVGLFGGLVVAGIPWLWWRTVQSVPPIHDISTDMETPPVFVAILPLRAGAPNSAEYGGPEIAAQQRAGYPDLGPLTLSESPAQVFPRALAAAHDLGWQVVASEPSEGRIEASATTFWFGFVDDVVVRITPSGSGSRIDVRSVSRVGRSDVGANAKRISTYLKQLAQSKLSS